MRNHHEKIKDIVESALPSTRRDSARRERALIHRRERARVRAELGRIRRCPDLDDFEDRDLLHEDRGAIGQMVYDRRSADKLGSLLRWADYQISQNPAVRELAPDGQYAYFRAILPANTIGRHALSHIEWAIRPRLWRHIASRGSTEPWVEARQELKAAIGLILATGLHGELNCRIKRTVAPPTDTADQNERPRTLAGQHDIDDFVRDVLGRPQRRIALMLAAEITKGGIGR